MSLVGKESGPVLPLDVPLLALEKNRMTETSWETCRILIACAS